MIKVTKEIRETKVTLGNDATYDDTELKTRMTTIENTVGNIGTTLDNINGEVVENVNS